MAFTASMPGVHKLQYTFFDDNGSDGSQGSIDNFYFLELWMRVYIGIRPI